MAYRDKREFARAIEDFGRAIAADPKSAVAYNNRGFSYRSTGDGDRAFSDFEQAIKLNPNYGSCLLQSRQRLFRKARLRTRRRRPEPGGATRSARPLAVHGRGIAYRERRDYDRAVADFDQALRLDPKFTAAYVDRGNVFQMQGDGDRAIQDYDQAIKLDPKYAAAFTERGNTYAARGKIDLRVAATIEQAIKFNPTYAGAFNSRAMMWQQEGRLWLARLPISIRPSSSIRALRWH